MRSCINKEMEEGLTRKEATNVCKIKIRRGKDGKASMY